MNVEGNDEFEKMSARVEECIAEINGFKLRPWTLWKFLNIVKKALACLLRANVDVLAHNGQIIKTIENSVILDIQLDARIKRLSQTVYNQEEGNRVAHEEMRKQIDAVKAGEAK